MNHVQKYAICIMFVGGMWASRPTVCIADSSEELIIGYMRSTVRLSGGTE